MDEVRRMADTQERKVLQLTLNDEFLGKIVEELNVMKTNHNKIVKITSGDKNIVLVISHQDNDMNKKGTEEKPEEEEKKE